MAKRRLRNGAREGITKALVPDRHVAGDGWRHLRFAPLREHDPRTPMLND